MMGKVTRFASVAMLFLNKKKNFVLYPSIQCYVQLPGGRLPFAHLHAALAAVVPTKICFLLDVALADTAASVSVVLKSLGTHARLVRARVLCVN